MTPAASANTREQLLALAQKLIRTRGYHGFSYRDLAEMVGVKTSSIHYHFPGKDDLLFGALQDYARRAVSAVQAIDATLPADARLDRYIGLMESTDCASGELCMGGMLAADVLSLPEPARAELESFFRKHEAWLAGVLRDGAAQGRLRFAGTPESAARAAFATVQGCLLVARLFKVPPGIRQALAGLYAVDGAGVAAGQPADAPA